MTTPSSIHHSFFLLTSSLVLCGRLGAGGWAVFLDSDDYQSTGVKCTDGYSTDPWDTSDCNVYGQTTTNSSFSCSSSDTVCKNIMYQTRCGALKRWAAESYSNAELSWAIMARHEIYWDPECVGTMEQVVEVQPAIKNGRGMLLAIMVLNIIIGSILGFIVPFTTIRNLQGKDWPCIPGEGETERKIIDAFKKYAGFLFKCGKVLDFPPTSGLT